MRLWHELHKGIFAMHCQRFAQDGVDAVIFCAASSSGGMFGGGGGGGVPENVVEDEHAAFHRRGARRIRGHRQHGALR